MSIYRVATLGLLSICLPPQLPAQQVAAAPGIHAGDWTYAAQAQLGDQRQDMGSRTVSIRSTGSGLSRAWLVVMVMQMEGQSLRDSITMGQADLRPLSRHATAEGTDIMLVVDDSAAHGLLTSGSSLVPLNIPLRVRSFLNYYSLRASFAEVPLNAGWTGQASVLELGRIPRFETLTLKVIGEERIAGPGGNLDCWKVAVKGPGIDEQYWISKERQDVIRTREPIGERGAIMQLDLTSFVPGP